MSEQDQGFTVKDRRPFDDQGNLKDQQEQAADAQAQAPEENAGQEAADNQQAPPPDAQLPPVDFSGLVLSLAHAAMMHLGQIPDLESGQPTEPNLPLARHAIDTIGMLKGKTTGNLTEEEQRILDGILTDLRLAYVHMNK